MDFTNLKAKVDDGMPVLSVFGNGGMTKLTVKQLQLAGRDLIAASQLINETGHHKGALIDKLTGHLCILGAVEVATYKKIGRVHQDHVLLSQDSPDFDQRIYRAINACTVLAATVAHLCECDRRGGSGPYDAVTHYNDAHCTGGKNAYSMLRVAAARALVLAERKHDYIQQFLTGVSA